ncbi:hypothetical protein JKF63_04295 [Porcisia hertigi]|uniref:Zinc finger Mcm10/DnaG-type domain-containing protein n=1 Tax=Porcisia hertigi TaxID=2761500 RepID=A0A836ISM6_9TRYP|nr:hypothetical protein JKF63_04295 [Porcisia hertigi]
MSEDLFDIFNDDVSSLTPAVEALPESGGPPAPSVIAPDTRTDTLASVTPEKRLTATGDDLTPSIRARSSAALAVSTPLPSACTLSPASPAPPPTNTASGPLVSPGTLPQSFSPHEHRAASRVPRSICANPSPLQGSGSGGITVINAAPISTALHGGGDGLRLPVGAEMGTAPREDAVSGKTAAPPPSAMFTETLSRIRIRRATVSFEQFSVRLAEFPFASFDVFRSMLCRSDGVVGRTCVGVVTRRSDPKQSTTASRSSRYAVLTLWNLESISPSPETELNFLLCGSAFDLLYSRLVTGSVVALSNVGRCAQKRPAPKQKTDEAFLRVADGEAVRQLGFAADLGTCASVSYKSKERCHAMVNTQRSPHCVYHVADLRRSARSGGAVGQDQNSRQRTRGVGAPSSEPPAVMRAGALTTHRTLAESQHRLAVLAPGRIASRCAGHHPTGSGSGASRLSGPVVNSRLAASQQMLRQTTFFAVRGASGLPVEDAALRSGVNCAASGVYGGVQAGAPLALRQQVGLQPAASYPSAQKLGVTSRGRDVLEAARQQAVHVEEEKLLRSSLRGAHTASAVMEGMPNDAHTDPGGSTRADSRDVVLGVQNRSAQIATAGKSTRTPSTSGALKRARAEAPLCSSPAPLSGLVTSTASYSTSLPAPIASMSHNASEAPGGGADGSRVEALRRQFQPLHRGASAPFTPLQSHGATHAVIASPRQRTYRHNVVIPGAPATGAGASASQCALLRAATKAARDLAGGSTTCTELISKAPRNASARLCDSDEGAETALTLLGSVADSLHSAQDHLRSEADRQRLLNFVDKQITKEKALEALEAITEQQIKAHYCYACRCWYGQPPTTCVEQHHRMELKTALKKYIKCEHCHYKTFVIGGEEAKGWKVYPCCPRCHQSSFWVRGDAALQVSCVVEASLPS